MLVITGSYHVFGSGSASASLLIDKKRVVGSIDLGDNGFVGWTGADVPVSNLLSAREVEWCRSATPGASHHYVGTGRGFIRRQCRSRKPDPLTVPLSQRPYAISLRKRREDASWAIARQSEKSSGRFQFRPSRGGLSLERREAIHIRLPDGCLGRKWGSWEIVPYSWGYYPPRSLWEAVI